MSALHYFLSETSVDKPLWSCLPLEIVTFLCQVPTLKTCCDCQNWLPDHPDLDYCTQAKRVDVRKFCADALNTFLGESARHAIPAPNMAQCPGFVAR